jgi:plasmid maintenance system antidote protein VapI
MEKHLRFSGEKLEAILSAQGRRRDWLAAQAGVDKSLITHLIAGRRTVAHEVAERISRALQVPFFVAFEFPNEAKSDSSEANQEPDLIEAAS